MVYIFGMNKIHNIDMNLLKLFVRVYECGSVTGAAQQFGLTQSAVSHGLKKLRGILGDPLFVRSGHALQPTSRAVALFPGVAEAFALLEVNLRDAAPFDPVSCEQQFHMAMTDYVETLALPQITVGLAVEAPNLTLKISEIAGSQLQEHGRVWDFMIARLGAELPPDFYAQKLWQDDFVTVCREDHPRVSGGEITLEAFLAEKHILVGTETAKMGAVDQALAQLGKRRTVQIATGFFLSPIRIAATSDLLATVPRRLAEQVAAELPIKLLPVPLSVGPFDITMAWSARCHNDPAHKWFRGWMKALLSD